MIPTEMSPAEEKARSILAQVPEGGLFAEKEWLIAPEPFGIDRALHSELEALGPRLIGFYRAAEKLYATGPAWIREWLDRGKPEILVRAARSEQLRGELPLVIRPDILLTEAGWKITELDSVPGGIGLTAWLQMVYDRPETMASGFSRSVLGGEPAAIVVSEESAVYRPEMEWLAGRAEGGPRVASPADLQYRPEGVFLGRSPVRRIYRFFELFDLPNIAGADRLIEAALAGSVTVTPPLKPALEEKMLLALFHSPELEAFWKTELGNEDFAALRSMIPPTWIVRDGERDWAALKAGSQKKRRFVLKLSGFSPMAWGGRSVRIGHDLPSEAWGRAIDEAIAASNTSPYVLQPFEKARRVPMEYFDFEKGELVKREGRARLCPFYMGEAASMTGILATIVPPDKKVIHGMRDAVMTLAV